jgi:hypothetical protein
VVSELPRSARQAFKRSRALGDIALYHQPQSPDLARFTHHNHGAEEEAFDQTASGKRLRWPRASIFSSQAGRTDRVPIANQSSSTTTLNAQETEECADGTGRVLCRRRGGFSTPVHVRVPLRLALGTSPLAYSLSFQRQPLLFAGREPPGDGRGTTREIGNRADLYYILRRQVTANFTAV